jgi:hypothetical protein
VREVPEAVGGQEGEEAVYQFAERIQGLLDLSDREAPEMADDLEKAVRKALTDPKRSARRDDNQRGRKERLGNLGSPSSVLTVPDPVDV